MLMPKPVLQTPPIHPVQPASAGLERRGVGPVTKPRTPAVVVPGHPGPRWVGRRTAVGLLGFAVVADLGLSGVLAVPVVFVLFLLTRGVVFGGALAALPVAATGQPAERRALNSVAHELSP